MSAEDDLFGAIATLHKIPFCPVSSELSQTCRAIRASLFNFLFPHPFLPPYASPDPAKYPHHLIQFYLHIKPFPIHNANKSQRTKHHQPAKCLMSSFSTLSPKNWFQFGKRTSKASKPSLTGASPVQSLITSALTSERG